MESLNQGPEAFPQTLRNAVDIQVRGEAVRIEGGPVLTPEAYQHLREEILGNIERDSSENPYHNRVHTEEVEARFLKLAREANLESGETETGGVSALLHDYGHIGQTVRQEAMRPGARKDISNEEYAALAAHKLLKDVLPEDRITAVQVAVLGTTFGQAEGPYARPYKPLSNMDKLLAFADIAGFTKGFDAWMEESMRVYREMPFDKLPSDFDTIVNGGQGFLSYVQAQLTEIAPLIGDAVDEYREKLAEIHEGLSSGRAEPYRTEFEAIRRGADIRKAA